STATGIVLKDTIPAGTTFFSSPFCSPPAGGVSSCPLPDLTPGSTASPSMTLLATSAGVVTNKAEVSSTEPDSNAANNTGFASTTVTVPSSAVQFFTVRASDAQNLLEWKNPAGPADGVSIHRTTAAPSCSFETNGANAATEIATPAFVSSGYDSLADP